MRVCLTGGTGLVGRRLSRALLERGDSITIITRDAERARTVLDPAVGLVEADPTREGSWQDAVRGSEAVVNLAGQNLFARRWTPRVKNAIEESRYLTTAHVAEAMATSGRKIDLVSASAVGYYGPRDDDEPLGEDVAPGHDFLAHVCVDWERACAPAIDAGARVVNARFGVVLDASDGALPRIAMPFRLFVGGPVGSGEQWVSWIHSRDLVRVLLMALDDARLSGPVNACSPAPVRMRELALAIGRALGRPSWFRTPAWALRLAVGEVSDVILTGQRVLPRRLESLGFEFEFPRIDAALAGLLGRARPEELRAAEGRAAA